MGFFFGGAFEAVFFIMFFLVFGMIVFTLIRGVAEWNKNNHSPRLTVSASVVTKRTQVSHHHHHHAGGGMHTSRSTSYYVTFEVESGDRLELHVSGSEYGLLAEGDFGMLTFQGTRYLSFDRTAREYQ